MMRIHGIGPKKMMYIVKFCECQIIHSISIAFNYFVDHHSQYVVNLVTLKSNNLTQGNILNSIQI